MVFGKEPKRRKKKRDAQVVRRKRERKVYDVWTQPTVKNVYAQLKVAETMLCRIPDIELTPVRRKMFELEDLMWQFLGG